MKYIIVLLGILSILSSCSVTQYLTPEQLEILAESEIFVDAITKGGKKNILVVIKNPQCTDANGDYILSLQDWKGAILAEPRFDTSPDWIEYVHEIDTNVYTHLLHTTLYQDEHKQGRKFVRERWSGTINLKEPP